MCRSLIVVLYLSELEKLLLLSFRSIDCNLYLGTAIKKSNGSVDRTHGE